LPTAVVTSGSLNVLVEINRDIQYSMDVTNKGCPPKGGIEKLVGNPLGGRPEVLTHPDIPFTRCPTADIGRELHALPGLGEAFSCSSKHTWNVSTLDKSLKQIQLSNFRA
jgi:hypothetical protein